MKPRLAHRALVPALLALALAAAPGEPAAAQSRTDAALARLGFKKAASGATFSCEGVELSGREGRAAANSLPAIVFVFLPGQASARANLRALEGLRQAHASEIQILAATTADRGSAASVASGLSIGYPIVAKARGIEPYGAASGQAFLVLAPGGQVLGAKVGPIDWSSNAPSELVASLVAAYPGRAGAATPGASPNAQGGILPAPGAPAPGAAASPNAAPPSPAAPPDAAPPSPDAAPQAGAPAPRPAAPVAAGPAPAQEGPGYLSAAESAVVAELGLARSSPKSYANYLREYRSHIRGNLYERPGQVSIMLNEGTRAVDEAIAFLERQAPLQPLAAARGLSRAAKDHARDQGPRGATGHDGSDGSDPFSRMERYGKWQRSAGENCAYGPEAARDIVIQLIVDDGVASRGHRANIFNPDFRVVGVGIEPHKVYGYVCVQDFAWGYEEGR